METIKRLILQFFELPNRIYNNVILKGRYVEYEKYAINGRIHIYGHGRIKLGDGFRCNSSLSANPVGGPYQTSLTCERGAELLIGKNVGISGTAIVAKKSIIIEDNVMIGSGCCIYDTDFHPIEYVKRVKEPQNGTCCPVHIGEGVFVGARSIILKGVVIGKHSVIAAGSVVTKSIPPNELWGGGPARFIRNLEETEPPH